jgi:hypothetical protein
MRLVAERCQGFQPQRIRAARILLIAAAAMGLASPRLHSAPVRILVALAASDEAEAASRRESLEAALVASAGNIAALRAGSRGEGLREEAAMKACALSLSVSLSADPDGERIEWSYEAVRGLGGAKGGGALASGSYAMPRAGIDDLAGAYWAEIVAALPRSLAALPRRSIIVSATPGTLVRGLGQDITVPMRGEAAVELPIPAYVEWSASSPGALSEHGAAYIDGPGYELAIVARPYPGGSIDLGLRDFSFAESRLSLMLGKRLFARLALAERFIGLSLASHEGPSPAPPLITTSKYLALDLGAGLGAYLMDPEEELRTYASIDAYVGVEARGDGAMALSGSTPFSLLPSAGAEWGPTIYGKLFGEVGWTVRPGGSGADYSPAFRLGWRFFF